MTDLFSFSVTYCHLVHVLHLLGIPCFEDWFGAFLIYWIFYWLVCGLYWVMVMVIPFTLYPLFSLPYPLPALNFYPPLIFSSPFLSLSSWLNWSFINRTITDDYWYNLRWSAYWHPHTHDSTNDEYDSTHQTLHRKKERGRNYK